MGGNQALQLIKASNTVVPLNIYPNEDIMTAEIEIIEKEIGNVIEIEERVPMWKMPSIMGKDFNLIMESLKAEGIADMDAPYARYLDVDWEAEMAKGPITLFIEVFTRKWHFRAGIPTPKKIENSGNLKSAQIPNRRYIKTIHHGPYHKVGSTYKRMYAWAKKQGLSLGKESMEFYLNDPRETDRKSLETMVLIPLG